MPITQAQYDDWYNVWDEAKKTYSDHICPICQVWCAWEDNHHHLNENPKKNL